ncbi:Histone H2A [Anabarilius grahami]|uniref:Histone H2A n=1 Tax=Anabarilius grahami TaxID=495550 RepID=A0A3N0XN30_ANAGA|nr:Histone H2A [Anabarilius grahami]
MTYVNCVLVKDCVSLTMKKKRKHATDLSARAGLVFPVKHFQQTFSDGKLKQTVDEEGAVFFTGVLEFLVAEILALAGQDAVLKQSNKITLHHLPGLQDRRRYAELLERSKEEKEEVGVAT